MEARQATVSLPLKPLFTKVMPKKISDIAMEKVPAISNRLSTFKSTLQIAHYAQGSITDYCHALYKAVLQIGKLPEEFTQEEVDGYLLSMTNRKPQPAEALFKHFIYGIKCYLNTMGFPQLAGLTFPKIRREKKLPRILSTQQIVRILRSCDLYSKALFSVIYDCGLRSFETCNLKWNDISFDRCQVHIKRGKGGKDRIVPISPKTVQVLQFYRKQYSSMNHVFKSFGADRPINNGYIRKLLRYALQKTGLNTEYTIHSLRNCFATHLLEAGEDIQTLQQRLGHKSVQTSMIYLHLAKIEKRQCIYLIENIFK